MLKIIRNILLIAITIAFIFYANSHFESYTLSILDNIGIFAILALSYNLINGVAGQFSLEPNGFVAIGAYFTAILLLPADLKTDMFALVDPAPIILQMKAHFIPAILIGGVASSIVALFLSLPVFRVRGDYLAIVTLGFGFIIRIFAINNPAYTNGAMGLNDIPSNANFIWIGIFALITFIVMINIIYSKFGRAMKSVRDDEDAATPDQFSFLLTFQLLIIIVLGGLGSMSGALIATILVMGGMEWLRFLDDDIVIFGTDLGAHPGLRMVVFAILLIVMMLFARRGLLGNKELFEYFKKKSK